MIKYIKKKLKIKRISVETIIEDLNQETVKKLKKAGVKRLSVGVQSFLSKTQKRSGRKTYDVTKAIKRILSAKDYFDTLSIDIIFNFKGQKIEFFKEDLKIFSELKLNQGTFYPLMDLKQSKEELRKEKEMYKILIDTMKKNEYTPSTVWCFSKGENIIDEYIVEYDNYVGLGPGAFSYLDGTLYANTFQLDKYEEILTQESIPAVLTKNVSKKDRMYYSLLTSLFSTKIDKKSFEKKFKKPIKKALFKELTVLKLFGFLKEDKTSFVLKPRGYYFVSVIAKEFFTSLNNLRDYCKKNKL